ncbi:MAG: cadmium-translocating P-type ATPase, partial [Epulopiscium sp.]|nr:cadmium-translocating P-type ATPase [Candidatus Epulonipiscium sp.]
MSKKYTRVLKLEGLDCASCADKIETSISKLDYIQEATVNFVMKTLTIEFKENVNIDKLMDNIKDTIIKIEPHVEVTEETKGGHSHSHDHGHGHDHGDMDKKKVITKLTIGVILFIIPNVLEVSSNVEFGLYLASYLIIGYDIVWQAIKNIGRRQIFDEYFLMTVATVGAFAIGQYAEGVAVMLFYQVGELFQDIAVNRSRDSITALMDIRPDFANLKVKDETVKVSPEEVKIGDIILIKPGEKVPLDGIVIKGQSSMDTSALTGESLPREIGKGDEALSGFINQTGVLEIEVTKEFGESTVTKILELVENASNRKAKTENFITKFARSYTPMVVGAAALIAIVPPLLISDATFGQYIYRALVFLVISCPCALVISIPLSFFGGIGAASKNGILVKGSNYLEALNHVETVVFDKTGTLTKGEFSVTEIRAGEGFTKEEVLEYAAYTEGYSNHPIALSILNEYGKEIDKGLIKDSQDIAGHGVIATIDGKKVATGNSKLMARENVKHFNEADVVGTIVHVAVNGQYAGLIVIADTIKDDAIEGIKALKELGIKETIMLTGDHKNIADKVGEAIGIDTIYAELLPHEKVEKLEEIEKRKSDGKNILFAGDGINDSPVIARADVGVAMGGLGSDAAIESADIVIMTDEPSKIVTSMNIAKRTQKIVWQNIIFALGVKLIVLILGAFGLATMW